MKNGKREAHVIFVNNLKFLVEEVKLSLRYVTDVTKYYTAQRWLFIVYGAECSRAYSICVTRVNTTGNSFQFSVFTLHIPHSVYIYGITYTVKISELET